eukprot:1952638-Rhodomonas_salina.2
MSNLGHARSKTRSEFRRVRRKPAHSFGVGSEIEPLERLGVQEGRPQQEQKKRQENTGSVPFAPGFPFFET